MRAAVFVVSPMAEYAARRGAPTSAAKTWPRFTPSWSGSGVFAAFHTRAGAERALRGLQRRDGDIAVVESVRAGVEFFR